MSEFDLIRAYFADLGASRSDVALGVGDDCALLSIPQGQQLAISIDTLAAGTHFFIDCDSQAVGHKSLAVGLSDLAAMGAEPAWATLALTLPKADSVWLAGFCRGFGRLAAKHGVRLVGGDTTRGPLSVTVQVHGFVSPDAAVRRSGARSGDRIFVTGTLGDAGLALRQIIAGKRPDAGLRAQLETPTPRIELGLALRGIATAMIDLSDGLAGDLGHILKASGVGAEVRLERLPLGPLVEEVVAREGDWALPLTSGDDYELCFCVPPDMVERVEGLSEETGCPVREIGTIRSATGPRWLLPDGTALPGFKSGYDHFAAFRLDS